MREEVTCGAVLGTVLVNILVGDLGKGSVKRQGGLPAAPRHSDW